MKRLIIALMALGALLPCSLFADEAVDEFKKAVAGLKAETDAFEKKTKEDPMFGFAGFGALVEKIKAVDSDDLPADLKAPWAGFVASLEKMAVAIGEMPKDKAELEKKFNDAAFMEAFGKKMNGIAEEMKPHVEKLKAAGAKYGITGLEELAPK